MIKAVVTFLKRFAPHHFIIAWFAICVIGISYKVATSPSQDEVRQSRLEFVHKFNSNATESQKQWVKECANSSIGGRNGNWTDIEFYYFKCAQSARSLGIE